MNKYGQFQWWASGFCAASAIACALQGNVGLAILNAFLSVLNAAFGVVAVREAE